MTTARDFSVMPVQVEGEPRTLEPRAVRSRWSMTPGAYVDVEFGAVWATEGGKPKRIPGQWRQCRIVKVLHSELHVVLDPSPAKAPPDVPFG